MGSQTPSICWFRDGTFAMPDLSKKHYEKFTCSLLIDLNVVEFDIEAQVRHLYRKHFFDGRTKGSDTSKE